MSYRFRLEESFEKGVRRILLSQIGVAERQLSKAGGQTEAIHESRKSFKRVRALLRLVRSGIGEAVFRQENAEFRDIARLLASARDRHVLLQTIVKLEAGGGTGAAPAIARLRQALQAGDNGSHAVDDAEARVKQALGHLKAARKRIGRLRLQPDSFEAIERGLRRTHKRSLSAMQAAFEQGSDEAFHNWRKGVQQHWRHMQLLSRAWPDYFDARIATAKVMSQILGEDHDLSMLASFADDRDRSGLNPSQARDIVVQCRSLQAGLRLQAAGHGRRLFASGPRSLGRHVAALWAAAAETAHTEARLAKRQGQGAGGGRSRSRAAG